MARPRGFHMMVFTGGMTRECYVWHGPFVCANRASLMQCFERHQRGACPPVRCQWDYTDATQTPKA